MICVVVVVCVYYYIKLYCHTFPPINIIIIVINKFCVLLLQVNNTSAAQKEMHEKFKSMFE